MLNRVLAQICLALLTVFVVVVLVMPRTAVAQSQTQRQRIDVREALRGLFRELKISYSIDPAVQGQVTPESSQESFEARLLSILRQVDATYRIEGGVYEIIRVNHLTNVRAALRTLFQEFKISYSIDPSIQGDVNVDVSPRSFEHRLQSILDQAHATYRVNGDTYQVLALPERKGIRMNPPDPALMSLMMGTVIETEPDQEPSTITSDKSFLYIVKGGYVYKLAKKDLAIVATRRLEHR
jgi:type II secretory pathway component GspD/PulD (secretin)